MKRSRFDIDYTKWLQQVDVDADDAVWNKIEDELDFAESWDNISTRLDVLKPLESTMGSRNHLKKFTVAAAILLLAFLPASLFIKQESHQIIKTELSTEEDAKEITEPSESTNLKTAEKDEVKEVQSLSFKGISVDELPLTSFSDYKLTQTPEIADSEVLVHRTDEEVLNRIQGLPFDAHILLASNDAIFFNLRETEFNHTYEPDKSSGFSFRVAGVGIVYGYKNTWLINQETRNGLNPTKLGNTLPTFHQDIGITSSFELNNQHLFGLEFLWKSEAGQNYQQYINGSYVKRNINLDYLKIQTFYLLRSNGFPGEAVLGGYMARLTMAEEHVDKIRLQVDDSYSKFDYGLLAGYQLNLTLKSKILVKPGIRVSYNLVNIFNGNDITPSRFRKTHNLSASFNISLSYSLTK